MCEVAKRELGRKIGTMNYDGLIADLKPQPAIGTGTIAKETAETTKTYKRGSIMARGEDGKLKLLAEGVSAEGKEAYGILCDDVTVDSKADVTVAVYVAGAFNVDKCTVGDSYKLTEADITALLKYGILFKAAQPAEPKPAE